MRKPELLAPAGDFEKLKFAINYGADAVYIGGQNFGLRAKTKNFDAGELNQAVSYAHERNVKIYVTANIYARNSDLTDMPAYFTELERIGADAVIISDPGVFMTAQKIMKNTEIHISTQANNTNYLSALFWHGLGAKRVVAARELSLVELKEIKDRMPADMKLEAFTHGAMCISYSGRCLLSAALTGRDANRGECSHPCRFKYYLTEEKRPNELFPIEEDERGTYIMNSKDLCTIEHVNELYASGLDSLKIEGRMKSAYYVAVVTRAYRMAIDDYCNDPELYKSKIPIYMNELKKTSHREFTTGFLFNKPNESSQNYESASYVREWDFVGIVRGYSSGVALVEQRNKFRVGDTVEFMTNRGDYTQVIDEMHDQSGKSITEAPHAQQLIRIKTDKALEPMDILRMEIK